MAPKPEDKENEFREKSELTPEKIALYEEYLRTGKVHGKTMVNDHAAAREIGTSLSRINKWQTEQNRKMKADQARMLGELDVLQKKTQTELMELIVKVSLIVILAVGLLTTGLYVFALTMGLEHKIIESTWSNLFGILLTNSFSIIGTIMGVKYASRKE